MAKPNSSSLVKNTRIIDLVRARGYKYQKKGLNYFVYCPEHENRYEDTSQPQINCFFKEEDTYCHCMACGTNSNALDFLIKKEGLSFNKACYILYDLLGKPSWAYNNKKVDEVELEEVKKKAQINEILGYRLRGIDKFLFPNETKAIVEYKKSSLIKRFDELDAITNSKSFEEERSII